MGSRSVKESELSKKVVYSVKSSCKLCNKPSHSIVRRFFLYMYNSYNYELLSGEVCQQYEYVYLSNPARSEDMRDIKSLLLVLLSIGLVGTWVYHLYDKAQYSRQRTEVYIKDSAAIAGEIRDSLAKIYSVTINELDNRLDSSQNSTDSLQNQLGEKLKELNKLKNEIGNILKNRTVSKSDLSLARKKIAELQQKVDELNSQNTSIEKEKNRLNGVLQQLTKEIDGLQQNIHRLNDENKNLNEKINLASFFVASEMSLNAIEVKKQKEQETFTARKADKFVVAFLVQNPIHDFTNTEVAVVVIQPDGQVLQNSDWDAGTFETKTQGTKSFTRKIKFDYTKGEQRKTIFSLDNEKFQKGTYILQLWHKGVMIGQTTKKLT